MGSLENGRANGGQLLILGGALAPFLDRGGYLIECIYVPGEAAIRVRPCAHQEGVRPDLHVRFPYRLRERDEIFAVARLHLVRPRKGLQHYAAGALFDMRGNPLEEA